LPNPYGVQKKDDNTWQSKRISISECAGVYRRGFINKKKIRQRKKIGVDKKPCKDLRFKVQKGVVVKITYPVCGQEIFFFGNETRKG